MFADKEQQNIKLIDFGLSKLMDENYIKKSRKRQSMVGTFRYMAPEILQGNSYDISCDSWSLGIILF
jgi:serine/threonine protein kinase